MIADVLVLALVVALAGGARSFLPADATVTGSGAALALGFVVLAALYTGRIFHRLRLPHLTGFLLCGAVLGPEVSGMLTARMVDDLTLVKRVAVGLIALVAGCELNLRALRPRLRPIGMQAAGGMVLAGLALCALFWASLPSLLPGMAFTGTQRLIVAAVTATVLCALSPAVVIGLLSETRASGPLSEAALSIVIVADLVIVVAFAAVNGVAASAFATGSGGSVAALVAHLGGSALVGGAVGLVLAIYTARVARRVGLFVFAVLFVVAEGGSGLHLDPLLVGLTAGLVLENATRVGGSRVVREVQPATVPVFALFFGVVGAEIHLDHFAGMAGWALAAAGVRAAGLTLGSRIGGKMAGVEPSLARLVPYSMLPQAGVALALADLLATGPHAWAKAMAPLVFGTIVVNELLGPILFRHALVRAGEVGRREGVAGHDRGPPALGAAEAGPVA